MTVPRIATVASSIAALTISGVTLMDLDEVPDALDPRGCPILAPSVADPQFLTEWELPVCLTLMGNMQVAYTLNYKLYQAPVGSDRSLLKLYPAMVATADRVAAALLALTALGGCKHISLAAMPQFGPVSDASGNMFHGAVIALRVTDF